MGAKPNRDWIKHISTGLSLGRPAPAVVGRHAEPQASWTSRRRMVRKDAVDPRKGQGHSEEPLQRVPWGLDRISSRWSVLAHRARAAGVTAATVQRCLFSAGRSLGSEAGGYHLPWGHVWWMKGSRDPLFFHLLLPLSLFLPPQLPLLSPYWHFQQKSPEMSQEEVTSEGLWLLRPFPVAPESRHGPGTLRSQSEVAMAAQEPGLCLGPTPTRVGGRGGHLRDTPPGGDSPRRGWGLLLGSWRGAWASGGVLRPARTRGGGGGVT